MQELLSDGQGNHHFFIEPNSVASVEFHDGYCLINLNAGNVYKIAHSELKRLLIQSGENTGYIPSPHSQKIENLVSDLGLETGYCVDIGAHDGLNHSNTAQLIQEGWQALMVECDAHRFSRLAHNYLGFEKAQLARFKATPDNIVQLLQAHQVPREFDFLSLDIDSYDYHVLDALLAEYKPTLILSEINEVIPPPIAFTVNYNPDFQTQLQQRFYGQSLAQLYQLAQKRGYHIFDMYYMDVFLIAEEYTEGDAPDIYEIYKQGLLERARPVYYSQYPFDVEAVLSASPEEALKHIQKGFQVFDGQFSCQIIEI